MAQFADYGFNRSHSIAYASPPFQTAYLKAHYPAYFFAAVLSHEADDSAKVYKYSTELRSMGLDLLPPDINESSESFTPSNNSVRFGLGAIKGIGTSTINSIVSARSDGPFVSLFDFVSRVDAGCINKRALEGLIKSGSFDSMMPEALTTNQWRSTLCSAIDAAIAFSVKASNDRNSGQTDLFGSMASESGSDGMDLSPPAPWSQAEMSGHEKAALGFYLSAHPLDEFKTVLEGLKIKALADHDSISQGDILTLAGIVSASQIRYSKKGNRFCIFRLEDQSGGVKCLVWAEAFGKCGDLIKDDALLIVEARVESAEGADITIIANEIRSLRDAESSNAKRLRIELPAASVDENSLLALFALLSASRGSCEVVIEVPIYGHSVLIETQALKVKGNGKLEDGLRSKGCTLAWHL